MNNISMIEQGNLSLFTSPFPTTPVNVDGSQVGFVEDSESDNNLTSPQNDSEVELKRKHTTLELEAEEKLKAAPKKKVRVSKDVSSNSSTTSSFIIDSTVWYNPSHFLHNVHALHMSN